MRQQTAYDPQNEDGVAGFRYRGGLVWRLEVSRRMLSCYPLSARRNLANSRPSRLHLPCRISELGMVWLGSDTEEAWFGGWKFPVEC